jgi:hypothetical protein
MGGDDLGWLLSLRKQNLARLLAHRSDGAFSSLRSEQGEIAPDLPQGLRIWLGGVGVEGDGARLPVFSTMITSWNLN